MHVFDQVWHSSMYKTKVDAPKFTITIFQCLFWYSHNSVQEMGQMNLQVRFWCSESNVCMTRYIPRITILIYYSCRYFIGGAIKADAFIPINWLDNSIRHASMQINIPLPVSLNKKTKKTFKFSAVTTN